LLTTNRTHQLDDIKQVTMISAWGFTMVIVSFLFLYIGYLIDGTIGTSPNFMLGLFILGLFLCMMRLSQEACVKRKDL
jgi:F0F1-type ATP synthase assembly protein I